MKNIFVAGHKGMVGAAIYKKLLDSNNNNVITIDRKRLDLINQNQVLKFFKENSFDEVYLAAAKVGGIYANNKYPANFIYENLMIQSNIIHASYKSNVNKLMFLGSSCIYPKHANQPMQESELLKGQLEPTNEPYAVAKIAGIKMCESYNRQFKTDYRSIMPTNLYGPGDNFNIDNSHVIPALIVKFHEAKINNKEVVVWGTGSPKREFLYVDDMADAAVFLMSVDKEILDKNTESMSSHINVGSGVDLSIKDLASLIAKVTEYDGKIIWDEDKPDGSPRKLLDVSKLKKLGWSYKHDLEQGLKKTYSWFLQNKTQLRS